MYLIAPRRVLRNIEMEGWNMDGDIRRVWTAAADLETQQHETDAAALDLQNAIDTALDDGAERGDVQKAAGLTDAEMTEAESIKGPAA
jgi:hypothetical protein